MSSTLMMIKRMAAVAAAAGAMPTMACRRSCSAFFSSISSSSAATATTSKIAGPVHICLLGAPGVGKGTFASRLGKHFAFPCISTGDLVRAEIASGSALGSRIKQATNSGQLLADDVVLSLLSRRLQSPDCSTNGFLLDGYPRRVSQAEALSAGGNGTTVNLDLVVNIELREDLLLRKITSRRVCDGCKRNYNLAHIDEAGYEMPPLLPAVEGVCDTCGGKLQQRPDDAIDVVRERLRVYARETLPLVEFYAKRGMLVSFEVRKGLNDYPRLLQVIEEGLRARRAGKPVSP